MLLHNSGLHKNHFKLRYKVVPLREPGGITVSTPSRGGRTATSIELQWTRPGGQCVGANGTQRDVTAEEAAAKGAASLKDRYRKQLKYSLMTDDKYVGGLTSVVAVAPIVVATKGRRLDAGDEFDASMEPEWLAAAAAAAQERQELQQTAARRLLKGDVVEEAPVAAPTQPAKGDVAVASPVAAPTQVEGVEPAKEDIVSDVAEPEEEAKKEEETAFPTPFPTGSPTPAPVVAPPVVECDEGCSAQDKINTPTACCDVNAETTRVTLPVDVDDALGFYQAFDEKAADMFASDLALKLQVPRAQVEVDEDEIRRTAMLVSSAAKRGASYASYAGTSASVVVPVMVTQQAYPSAACDNDEAVACVGSCSAYAHCVSRHDESCDSPPGDCGWCTSTYWFCFGGQEETNLLRRLLELPRADVADALSSDHLKSQIGDVALLADAYVPCNDTKCEWFENSESCYTDCHCGDRVCDRDGALGLEHGVAAESVDSCFDDCHCGDGTCLAAHGESPSACYEDCHCGDGFCDWKYRNENNVTCAGDCHCGDGVCDADWGETPLSCRGDAAGRLPGDCWCGDGVCSATENWLTCEADCSPRCGNGVCECTSDGVWGGDLCCFAGYEGVPWRDGASAADGPVCEGSETDIGGPETQESCPFDCGVPCPPFCEEVEVCSDSSRLFPVKPSKHEVEYRKHTATDAWGVTHAEEGAAWQQQAVEGADATSLKVTDLLPESKYDLRVRASNDAGDGPWSEVVAFETSGLPAGGECLHDDAPCTSNGEIQQITYLHAGAGCTGSPIVSFSGGNCAGYNETELDKDAAGDDIKPQYNGTNSTNATAWYGCPDRRAAARAIVAGGMVVGFEVLDGGTNYTEAPTVTVDATNCTLQASAVATIDPDTGVVTKVEIVPACLTPGGSTRHRIKLPAGSEFKDVRKEMQYAPWASCAWHIAPEVPSGYTLRLRFEHFNVDASGGDVLQLFDGYPKPDDDGVAFEQRYAARDLRADRALPVEARDLPKLVQGSGERAPEDYAPQSEEALLAFSTDGRKEAAGGFKLSWQLQPLQPPERPDPPTVREDSITLDSASLSWVKPKSTLAVERFLIEVRPWDGDVSLAKRHVVSAAHSLFTLLRLEAAATYVARVQAWTTSVTIDSSEKERCADGENSLCSKWSTEANITTQAFAMQWFVSPDGSFLYGSARFLESSLFSLPPSHLLLSPQQATARWPIRCRWTCKASSTRRRCSTATRLCCSRACTAPTSCAGRAACRTWRSAASS